MLSKTLQTGLAGYAIGEKLRALRLKKKMGLVELGGHTGLSPALLSKIERGHIFPTLPTLLRIALVFSVGLEFFFARTKEAPLFAVARRADRVRLPERAGARDAAYQFESLDFVAVERPFNAYLAEFAATPAGKVREHSHAGAEFLYVLEGTLAVNHAGSDHELAEGDSAFFDATQPHGYRKAAGRRCRAIVVTAP